ENSPVGGRARPDPKSPPPGIPPGAARQRAPGAGRAPAAGLRRRAPGGAAGPPARGAGAGGGVLARARLQRAPRQRRERVFQLRPRPRRPRDVHAGPGNPPRAADSARALPGAGGGHGRGVVGALPPAPVRAPAPLRQRQRGHRRRAAPHLQLRPVRGGRAGLRGPHPGDRPARLRVRVALRRRDHWCGSHSVWR
ncbi:unnamed protein product, partial [Prorocentrum cordatum]